MTRILACVDGSVYAESVADHAAWAAKALGASVELLQVLGRREARGEDYTGLVLADGQQQLLARLSSLDAERFKLLQQSARLGLDAARARIRAAGVAEVTATLRTGDLLEEFETREADAALAVVGKRGEAADFARLHLGSNLERIVRASARPVLIASRAFRPVRKAVVAFDGRSGALKALETIAHSPLSQGVAFEIVTAGDATPETRRQLDGALATLRAAGLPAEGRIAPGEPAPVIQNAVEQGDADLLVMGAFGHSRLRSFVIGSVTSELIRGCKVPALVCR
jgi:nucleotide-binding universal stress UspA family protein